MTDRYGSLHGNEYKEWKEKRADEFAKVQRKSFIAGFEAAADESENFNLLRQWLAHERDKAHEQHQKGDNPKEAFVRYLAFVDVLTKLSEMGCMSDDTESEGETDV